MNEENIHNPLSYICKTHIPAVLKTPKKQRNSSVIEI